MKTQSESHHIEERVADLRVAGGSAPAKVAGAVVKNIEEGKAVSLLAMGAGAVNQAVKALCIARGMAAPQGRNLYMIPAFRDEVVQGEKKTAIQFFVRF